MPPSFSVNNLGAEQPVVQWLGQFQISTESVAHGRHGGIINEDDRRCLSQVPKHSRASRHQPANSARSGTIPSSISIVRGSEAPQYHCCARPDVSKALRVSPVSLRQIRLLNTARLEAPRSYTSPVEEFGLQSTFEFVTVQFLQQITHNLGRPSSAGIGRRGNKNVANVRDRRLHGGATTLMPAEAMMASKSP